MCNARIARAPARTRHIINSKRELNYCTRKFTRTYAPSPIATPIYKRLGEQGPAKVTPTHFTGQISCRIAVP